MDKKEHPISVQAENYFSFSFFSKLPDASLLFDLTFIKNLCKLKAASMPKKKTFSLFPTVSFFFFLKEENFLCNHFYFSGR